MNSSSGQSGIESAECTHTHLRLVGREADGAPEGGLSRSRFGIGVCRVAAIVRGGRRLCVVHDRVARVVVGGGGEREDVAEGVKHI